MKLPRMKQKSDHKIQMLKLVEEWRFRRVPYLERVLNGNFGQFSFIMKEFRKTARDLNLKESYTAYMSWGKGAKSQLRFSKSGDYQVERHYSTHYVKPPNPEQAQLQPLQVNLEYEWN
ncbi:hypothetical protein GC102_00920 [Paenibacillus sp. LMG 31460]|uniref:Uncharacterized protein n=1 Tax=Paenibacillus germinis TaxID=2654979 RepID=A0ABX1YTT4_9BACL|nr:hypothetical protein [Paenibacillus germinis]NOU84352.1 hypothetical protein [Paenibacillus germinis]